MRYEVAAAFTIGMFLPVLETVRRGFMTLSFIGQIEAAARAPALEPNITVVLCIQVPAVDGMCGRIVSVLSARVASPHLMAAH